MKNKPGFSLIELMISLLISAMIISGLFSTLYQIGQTQTSLNTVTDVHQKAAILFSHLERDIMGSFIPEQVDPIKLPKKSAAVNVPTTENKVKPIDKVFYGKSRDDKNLEQLTFITSNALQVYAGIKNSKQKPRTARVVYRLEPQKGVKESFVFSRQEGADLNYELYRATSQKKRVAPIYTMIDNIASLSITYLTPAAQKEKTVGVDQKIEYKKTKKWNSEIKQEKNNQISYKLPEFVEISLVLWDMAHEKKFDFSYTVPIMFQKGKPKRQAPAPQRTPARQVNQRPPSIAVSDGSRVTVTRDKNGKFIVEQVRS